MSAKKKNNSISSVKCQKVKQLSGSNILNSSEVIKSNKSQEISNKNAFSNITHKNSSGANNWAKFAELSQQKKDHQSTKRSLVNKNQVQTGNISSGNKINFPSKNPNNIQLKIGKTQINPRQYSSKTPNEAVSKSNVSNAMQEKNVHFIESRSNTPKSTLTKLIALDCEMVGVEIGVNKNMLARISLVNSHGDCIYDKFVKPTEPVLDYRTRVSGVRPKDLENATDFKIVQREVAEILKGRILVGHALKNDLKVLYLSHPRHSIRDTSKFQKFREGKTPALKKLAKRYLGVTIQEGEHSSVQDALAAMQLYKMFKKEWESSIYSKKHQIKKSEKSKPPQLTPNKSIEMDNNLKQLSISEL